MKTNLTYLLIVICFFWGCKKAEIKEAEICNNGINKQILEIVDSLYPLSGTFPFVTIWAQPCTYENENSVVVLFFNGLLLPTPNFISPSETILNSETEDFYRHKKTLSTEFDDFLGYKKYNDIYLVF